MPAKKKAAKKKAVKKATRAAKKKVVKKPKKVVKKKAVKKPAVKKAKRPLNPAFMRPMTPSADLAEIVGNKPLPRTQITKKIWDYIKKNGLQDKVHRTMINADEKLRKIFGGRSQVSMFEMTKLVNKHLS